MSGTVTATFDPQELSKSVGVRSIMKTLMRLHVVAFLAGLFAVSGFSHADQHPPKAPESKPADTQTVLEEAQASGTLPEGMLIRISACMGAADAKALEAKEPPELRESWEFTSNQVHRVEIEIKNDKCLYRRIESRPFDTKEICKALLDGKAVEIQARKGEGPEMVLSGTVYNVGSRSIEVVWRGNTILQLGETNGPALHAYRDTDARAFGQLYERLARQARELFKPTPADAK